MIRDTWFAGEYQMAAGAGPMQASQAACTKTVKRLGHARDRADQAKCYLGDAA